MKLFSKISHGATKLFNKVSHDAPKILNKVSTVAKKVGGVLDTASKNPLIAAVAGPEANLLLGAGANASKQISGLTNTKNYHGGVNTVSQNILERAQNLSNTAPQPTFH